MGVIKMLLLTTLALGVPLVMGGLLLGSAIGTPTIDNALGELNSAVSGATGIFDADPPTVGQAVDGDTTTGDPNTAPTTSPQPTPLVLYVGQTGGFGVALRGSCADAARLETAWADNTAVEVVTEGDGECDGWLLVESGGEESWVRAGFLIDAPLGAAATPTAFAAADTPPEPAATQPPAGGGSPAPAPPASGNGTTTCSGPASGTQHVPAPAASLPFLAYGIGLCAGDIVEPFVNAVSCGVTSANADGEWSFQLSTADPCTPTDGVLISFSLNGVLTGKTEIFSSGGVPANRDSGIDLS